MKRNKYTVSILLPVIKEDQNLYILLKKLKKILKNIKYEIIIIGSYKKCDESESISKKFNVKFFRRLHNNNYGNAIRMGLKKTDAKNIIIMDSDGSHNPIIIPKMINLSNKFDLIIASRYIDGGKTLNSMLLIFLSKLVNFAYSIILNLKIKDISNSYRLYNAKKLKNIKLSCNHFDIIEEILFKLQKKYKNFRFKEIPCVFSKRHHGKSKRNLLLVVFYLITLFRIRFFNL